MSTASEHARSGSRLSGRWQVPLAMVAATVGAITLYRLAPPAPQRDFDALLADLAVLEGAGETVAAADAVANLLETQPPLPAEQRAVLHERLAELLFRIEQGRAEHDPDNLAQIVHQGRVAVDLGHAGTPRAALRDAFARVWFGDRAGALEALQRLLDQELTLPDFDSAVRALLALVEDQGLPAGERQAVLARCLARPQLSTPLFWSVLQQAVTACLEQNRPAEADALLETHAARLTTSELKNYLEYLRALVLLHEGRMTEAEPLIQWVVEDAPRTRRAELDEYGHLPSLAQLLLGRLRLAQDRPEEAATALEHALELHPGPAVRAEAALELGRARARLGAHVAAQQALALSLTLLSKVPANSTARREALLETLIRLHDQRRAAGDFASAVAYLALAGRADAEAGAADGDDPLAWRRLQLAADVLATDEPRVAELLWWAAEEYSRVGRPADEYRALEQFVYGRREDPRLPTALLRLGQACEAGGMVEDALRWYARLQAAYPRLPESAWATLGLARLRMARDPAEQEAVEAQLAALLTGERASPDAEVYRAALLALCELLLGTGRYGQAIGRLEEFCELYPGGADGWQARFMLADAYRRSAAALRSAPPAGIPNEAAAAESVARYRLAAQYYDELVRDLDAQAEPDTAMETYTRLALLYLGDCYFELNDPETLKAALRTYSAVAMRYPHDPAALAAGAQLANTCLRLGDPAGAARALESARWALRNTPAAAFRARGAPDVADWDRLLVLVSDSGLFENAVEAAARRPEERP